MNKIFQKEVPKSFNTFSVSDTWCENCVLSLTNFTEKSDSTISDFLFQKFSQITTGYTNPTLQYSENYKQFLTKKVQNLNGFTKTKEIFWNDTR